MRPEETAGCAFLFVHPSPLEYSEIFLRLEPLGLERFAPAARRAGHDVRVVDLQVCSHSELYVHQRPAAAAQQANPGRGGLRVRVIAAGIVTALAASVANAFAVVLQAAEARRSLLSEAGRLALVTRLARRRRWLAEPG
jgi:hypothetical protein